jgi:hypothetical protein
MDLVRLSIPAAFVLERARLTWREILYGVDNDLLAPGAAVDFAVDVLAACDDPSPDLVALAALGKGRPGTEILGQLAASEPGTDAAEIRAKWLFLVLAWMFAHQQDYADPLQAVEEVYADFGYPARIAGFVRYMPADEPDLGSRELNERRLYEKWKRYLDEASAEYGLHRRAPAGTD